MQFSVPAAKPAVHELDLLELQILNEVEGLSSILQLTLRLTGLKFAAIGKFADEHWVTYIINDEMHLGLKPGDSIPEEVVLCNKVQQSHAALVIPCASSDTRYKDHPTIVNFGLGSFVSLPVFLINGELFGTLCAAAPEPASLLADQSIIDSLKLFARLSGRLLSLNLACPPISTGRSAHIPVADHEQLG